MNLGGKQHLLKQWGKFSQSIQRSLNVYVSCQTQNLKGMNKLSFTELTDVADTLEQDQK